MSESYFRKAITLIKAGEIKQNFSMLEAIDAMEMAFKSLSSGNSFVPQRTVTSMADGSLNLMLKPAAIDSLHRASIKIITQKERGVVNGVPAIVGVVMVLDTKTGEVLSIMDGEYLTALRTGAASGLATKCFARKNANVAAIFGCGTQGKTQLAAVAAVRKLSKVWVFDKSKKVAELFIDELKPKLNIDIELAESNRVLKECDIICTATNAENPLFSLEEIKEGTHINAIGSYKPNMQELDPEVLANAKIYVDQLGPCLAESGDFIKPINNGLFTPNEIVGEIGQFALGNIAGRNSESEITLFKSVGVAIQDFIVANSIYEKSLSYSFGQTIKLFE